MIINTEMEKDHTLTTGLYLPSRIMAPGKGNPGKPYNYSRAGRGRARTGVWLQDAPRTSGPLKPGNLEKDEKPKEAPLKPGNLENDEKPKEDQDLELERSPRRARSGRVNPVLGMPPPADSPPSPLVEPEENSIGGAEVALPSGTRRRVHFVNTILIRCPNSHLGCHTNGPEEQIKQHARCCDYQRIGCPSQYVNDVERCQWTGAANDLEYHIRSGNQCASIKSCPYFESTFQGSIRDNPFWKGENADVTEVPLPYRRWDWGRRAGTVFTRMDPTYWAPVLLEAPGLTNYRLFLLVVRSRTQEWYLTVRSLNPLLGNALVTLEVYRSERPVGAPVHTWSGPVSSSNMNNTAVRSSGQFLRLNDAQVHLLDTHQRWDQPPGHAWPGAKSPLDKDLQSLFEWTIQVHTDANLPWFRTITSLPQRDPSPPGPEFQGGRRGGRYNFNEPPLALGPSSVGPTRYGPLGRGGWMPHHKQDANDPDYDRNSLWQTTLNKMERKERERIAQNLALEDQQETNSLVTTAQVEKGDDYPATGAKMKKREDLPANSPLGAKMKKREDLPANNPLVGKTGLGTRANPPRSRLDRPMNLQRRLQGLSLGGQRLSLGEEDLSSPSVTIPTLQPLPVLTPFPEPMSSPTSLEEGVTLSRVECDLGWMDQGATHTSDSGLESNSMEDFSGPKEAELDPNMIQVLGEEPIPLDNQEELGLFRPLRPPYEYRPEMPVISYPSRRQGPEGEETLRGQLHQLTFEDNSRQLTHDHAELDLQMHALGRYMKNMMRWSTNYPETELDYGNGTTSEEEEDDGLSDLNQDGHLP
jgi:hypothetical protein